MAKCKTDPIHNAALNHISKVLSEIENSYDQTFGSPVMEVHAPAIKKIDDDIADIQLDINIAKGRDKIKLDKQKKKLKKQKHRLVTANKEAGRKLHWMKKLRGLMVDKLKAYADDNLYNITPDIYFPVIKEMLKHDLGRPFKTLDLLYEGDLRAIYGKLNRMYKHQAKEAIKTKIPKLRQQHSDATTIALKHDPSLRAYNLVIKSRHVPTEIFSRVNKWDNAMRNARTPFEQSVESDEFLFRVNTPPGGMITEEEITESLRNATKFASDILDGNTRYIIPKPLGFVKKTDPRYKELQPYQKDRKKYEEKVREDILSGINDGKNIQKRIIGGQTFYYVPILQPSEAHGGKEVWYAYQVPHKPPKEGQKSDFLMLPRSKGKEAKDQAKRQEFDELIGNLAPLATYTKADGRVITGRMEEGWYNATTHPALSGKKKVKVGGQLVEKDYIIGSYSGFVPVDNINPVNDPKHDGALPPGFWPMISDIRTILASYYLELGERIKLHEAKMSALIVQANKSGSKFMNREDFNKFLKTITQLNNLRGGLSIKDGQIFTSNTVFSAQETFFPRRWDPNGTVTGMQKGMQAIKGKIEKKGDNVEGLKEDVKLTGADHMKELTNLTTQIKDLEESLEVLEENFDVFIGVKDITDAKEFTIERSISAAQHRSAFMPPLPGRTDPGRRGDFDVFHEYFYDSERGMANLELSYDLLNVTMNSSKAVSLFALDQVKATMGRQDIESGMLGISYNDVGFTKMLNATLLRYRGKDNKITPTTVHNVVRMFSMLVSANLLQIGAVLTNHWQKLSPWAYSTADEYIKAGRLMKMTVPPGMTGEGRLFSEVIAEASGVTDVVTALADALLGSLTSELTGTDGFWTKKDLLILHLPLVPFKKAVKNTQVWKRHFSAALERRTDVSKATGDELMNIYEGTWMLINGITENSITPAKMKKIAKLYQGVLSAETLNNYASWGLSGAYLSGTWSKLSVGGDLRKVLTFTGVEESMRTWDAVLACVMCKNMKEIPQEWIDEEDDQGRKVNNPYLHPNALKFARIMNNITMFGLSDQYLNVMMRGSVGKAIWKFKGYTYNQMIREWKQVMHLWDSMTQAELKTALTETFMLIPPALPGSTVANEKFAEWTTGKKRQSYVHETFRKAFWSRGLISLWVVSFFYMPGISEAFKLLKNKMRTHAFGPGARAIERGGASAIGELIFRAMFMAMAAGGAIPADEDDKDRVYEDFYRYLLPLIVNMGMDVAKGEPWKALRVLSQTPYRILDFIGVIDED